jgi:hypothetical protein
MLPVCEAITEFELFLQAKVSPLGGRNDGWGLSRSRQTCTSVRTMLLPLTMVLLSCSAQPDIDPLEARAKAGDVSAACDLVLRDLQRCAAARKDWMAQLESPRPDCLDDPVPADHQRHFSQAIDALEGPPERSELLKIISDGVANTAASLKLGVGAPERFDATIDTIAQSCATLRG